MKLTIGNTEAVVNISMKIDSAGAVAILANGKALCYITPHGTIVRAVANLPDLVHLGFATTIGGVRVI